MIEKRLLSLLLLLSFSLSAQVKGVVKDSLSGKPIAYVNIWVENENIGTTSEINGSFSLELKEEKNIIFSALGYETKILKSTEIENVSLYPKVYELEEVVVSMPQRTKEIKMGKFKKNKINLYYGSGKQPTILAKKIEYSKEVETHPFLKQINFLSFSQIEQAKIILRFFEVDPNGSPDLDFLDKNILITVKKGKNNTIINLEEYNIRIPKEGLFIAFESIIVAENKFNYEYTIEKEGETIKRKDFNYQPSIGTTPSETQTSWTFAKGKWLPRQKHAFDESKSTAKYQNKFGELAIEITLTN